MWSGLITEASDNDPSGIATNAQGWGSIRLWPGLDAVANYPLIAAIQEISARIGRVTGCGVAGNLRRHYSPWLAGRQTIRRQIA